MKQRTQYRFSISGLLFSILMSTTYVASSQESGEMTKEQFSALLASRARSDVTSLLEKHSASVTGSNVPRSVLMRLALSNLMVRQDRRLLSNDVRTLQSVAFPGMHTSTRAEKTLSQACERVERASTNDARAIAVMLMEADSQAEDDLAARYERLRGRVSQQARVAFDEALTRVAPTARFTAVDLVGLSEEVPDVLLDRWKRGCARRTSTKAAGVPASSIRLVPTEEAIR